MAAPEDTRVTLDPIRLDKQEKYLDLLAVFHYVVAGLAAFFSLFALIYVGLGGAIMASPATFADGGESLFLCSVVSKDEIN